MLFMQIKTYILGKGIYDLLMILSISLLVSVDLGHIDEYFLSQEKNMYVDRFMSSSLHRLFIR